MRFIHHVEVLFILLTGHIVLHTCLLATPMINLVDKELFTDINKLPMDNPSIELVEKHSVAAVENLRKHVLDNRVATSALHIEGIQNFASFQTLILNLIHEV